MNSFNWNLVHPHPQYKSLCTFLSATYIYLISLNIQTFRASRKRYKYGPQVTKTEIWAKLTKANIISKPSVGQHPKTNLIRLPE